MCEKSSGCLSTSSSKRIRFMVRPYSSRSSSSSSPMYSLRLHRHIHSQSKDWREHPNEAQVEDSWHHLPVQFQPRGCKCIFFNVPQHFGIKNRRFVPLGHAVHRQVVEYESLCALPPSEGKLDPFQKDPGVFGNEQQPDPGNPLSSTYCRAQARKNL